MFTQEKLCNQRKTSKMININNEVLTVSINQYETRKYWNILNSNSNKDLIAAKWKP